MCERVVFHVDVNSAFLSWEAVDRLKKGDTVDLRTIPSAVGGSSDNRHGIISARSIPAKKMGVQSGEAVVKALQKCPGLVLVRSNFSLYSQCSKAFMKICREYTDLVEQFSVDECFMDMTEFVRPLTREKAVEVANELRERIHRELGFTVNIGVSENKLLAKMASDFLKPDKTHTLWRDEIETKMWPLPAGDMLFVGKAGIRHLETLGIRTIGDVAALPLSVLVAHIGDKGGHMMYDHAHGIDDSPVVTERDDEKSYSHSMTVPVDIVTEEEAFRLLRALSDMVTKRMRKDDVRSGLVSVVVRSNEMKAQTGGFKQAQKQRKLDYYTYASDLIFKEAKQLFTELWDRKTPIRLLSVSCGNIIKGDEGQLNFFVDEERKKKEDLDNMLDKIRDKFGPNALKRLGSVEGSYGRDNQKE